MGELCEGRRFHQGKLAVAGSLYHKAMQAYPATPRKTGSARQYPAPPGSWYYIFSNHSFTREQGTCTISVKMLLIEVVQPTTHHTGARKGYQKERY